MKYQVVIRRNGQIVDAIGNTGFEVAYEGWRMIRDYGQDGVTAQVQRQVEGRWVPIDPERHLSEPVG